MKFIGFILAVGLTGNAFAQSVVNLSAGQWQNVNGTIVTCESNGPQQPPPPPPPKLVRVNMFANVSCLNAIPATDGKDTARRADRCDANNQNKLIGLSNCSLLSISTNYNLAEAIIDRATTVIYEHQKESVRMASSDRIYECRY